MVGPAGLTGVYLDQVLADCWVVAVAVTGARNAGHAFCLAELDTTA